mmetsp:Transcript_3292/g.4168  ORF Transcript_3292/g.4168 Transcript_3292/m.4168 type:complete len:227 (-) Transcript_3292:1150-1830(-)
MFQRLGLIGRLAQRNLTRRGSKGYDWYYKQLAKDEEARKIQEAKKSLKKLPPLFRAKKRPQVYLEFTQGEEKLGRVSLELAADILPVTCSNFMDICKNKIKGLTYEGTIVHRVVNKSYICGGDVVNNDGTGGCSTYDAPTFEDEGFAIQHHEGIISMNNFGVHTNHSQFFITARDLYHLDGRNVAFGQVLEGMELIHKMSTALCVDERPVSPIRISACGVLCELEK